MANNMLFDAQPRTLKILAALVWYSGFVVLYIKSSILFVEAHKINDNLTWTWLAVAIGFAAGAIKSKYLFRNLCIKNLKRINTLEQPKIWQFYRMPFLIFLFSMIVLGLFLSQWIHGNYAMLLTMAVIELSIATALLTSSHCFWTAPTDQ
ncbi:MAG: hypothetical protein OQK76_12080 [Gammaproteobacteria bacterium]|nr:hypothetical protein [Gammaproteobacteria bacterium]MCW8911344.1 hypothetical protein [Gammaproteobacteria bacterium]MCW9005873.1 hypothetical protein [Gammaproteobacteria bacterium]MCW9055099.1 hypothetical protein [Gammaproteobacteria bacterium]